MTMMGRPALGLMRPAEIAFRHVTALQRYITKVLWGRSRLVRSIIDG